MTLDLKAAALVKATLPATPTTKIGLKIMKQLTGIEHLHCPQCRRKNLLRRKGTLTVSRGKEVKKVAADFAVCNYCHCTASISEVPYSHVLILSEAFFPGDKCIEVDVPCETGTLQ